MTAFPRPTAARIAAYRTRSFRTVPEQRVTSLQEAERFVHQRGYLFFWPPRKIAFPSLWAAVAGDRHVPNHHDDPGHVTWAWKDSMLPTRRWYYGKLLRGRAMMVSLSTLPAFYALSSRTGDLDDFIDVYHAGSLPHEAYRVARVILEEGPQNSIQLRRKAGLSAASAKYPFERALTILQKGLWILPIGVADAGTWHYAFEYELLDRWLPDVLEAARCISDNAAREELLKLAFSSLGSTDQRTLRLLFGWKKTQLAQTLGALQAQDYLKWDNEETWWLSRWE